MTVREFKQLLEQADPDLDVAIVVSGFMWDANLLEKVEVRDDPDSGTYLALIPEAELQLMEATP